MENINWFRNWLLQECFCQQHVRTIDSINSHFFRRCVSLVPYSMTIVWWYCDTQFADNLHCLMECVMLMQYINGRCNILGSDKVQRLMQLLKASTSFLVNFFSLIKLHVLTFSHLPASSSQFPAKTIVRHKTKETKRWVVGFS